MQLINMVRDMFSKKEEPIYKTISSILERQSSYYDQAMALYDLFGIHNPLLLEVFFYKQRMINDRLINTISVSMSNNHCTLTSNKHCARNIFSDQLLSVQRQRNIYDKAELAVNMQTHMRLGFRTAIQFDNFIAFARMTLLEMSSQKEDNYKKDSAKKTSNFYETFSLWLKPMLWDCTALCSFLEEKDRLLRKDRNIDPIDNDAYRSLAEIQYIQKTLASLYTEMYCNDYCEKEREPLS